MICRGRKMLLVNLPTKIVVVLGMVGEREVLFESALYLSVEKIRKKKTEDDYYVDYIRI